MEEERRKRGGVGEGEEDERRRSGGGEEELEEDRPDGLGELYGLLAHGGPGGRVQEGRGLLLYHLVRGESEG